MFGYMNVARLIELVEEYQTIAILPYIYGYNASYSAIFFVTIGIPVVVTNLDIFLESQNNGARIVLVDRTLDAFATAISTIPNSSNFTDHLIENDKKIL